MKVWAVFFALAATIIVAAWWWLGAPARIPVAPLAAGEKLPCVSYAPFRGDQTPLDLSTRIPAWQIEEDLIQLAPLTECVRTYSVNLGLDQITPIAQRHGLKVLQGLWLGRDPEFNRFQIDTAVALANRYPDVIRAIVVGNEVLLRGELSAAALTDVIRKVKAAVPVPVTYADVWEFWLRTLRSPQRSILSPSICCHTGRTCRFRPARRPIMSLQSRVRSRRLSPARKSWSGSSAGRVPAGCAKARCHRRSTR